MKRILVVGDAFEDIYTEASFKKMCPDAPSIKAVVTEKRISIPGGAANVAINLAELAPSAFVDLIAVMSFENARVTKYLSKNRVSLENSYYCDPESGITKERLIVDGELAIRIDNKIRFRQWCLDEIAANLKNYLMFHHPEFIVISDYGSGVLQAILPLLQGSMERVLLDTKETELSQFSSGTKPLLIKLNADEWKNVLANDPSPERHFHYTVITRGGGGAELRMQHERSPDVSVTYNMQVPAIQVEAIDVCGCGDTFLAGLAASFLRNDDPYSAIQFANAAASTVVTQKRTAVADLKRTLELTGRENETFT